MHRVGYSLIKEKRRRTPCPNLPAFSRLSFYDLLAHIERETERARARSIYTYEAYLLAVDQLSIFIYSSWVSISDTVP